MKEYTENMSVECYWNLHKHVYSVRHKGLVIGHFPTVVLADAKFVVRQTGRKRVLSEGVKNVHAFVRGKLCSHDPEYLHKSRQVTYNPYKYETFVELKSKEPVHECEYVLLTSKQTKETRIPLVYLAVLTEHDAPFILEESYYERK